MKSIEIEIEIGLGACVSCYVKHRWLAYDIHSITINVTMLQNSIPQFELFEFLVCSLVSILARLFVHIVVLFGPNVSMLREGQFPQIKVNGFNYIRFNFDLLWNEWLQKCPLGIAPHVHCYFIFNCICQQKKKKPSTQLIIII